MQPTAADPQKHPTVRLDGKDYELKLRVSDLVNLQKNHSIDLLIPAVVTGTPALEKLALVICAAVTHTGVGITPQFVMDSMDLSEIPIYVLAVAEAQKKVSSEAQAALATLQGMTQPKPDTTPSTVQ
jgi:hypothetical protein